MFQPVNFAAFLAAAAIAHAAVAQTVAQSAEGPRAASGQIRRIASRHLVLYTDLPSNPDVDSLPGVFDRAVGQWAEYFGIEPAKTANWQAQAYLIGQRRRFDALGLMPAGNDQFKHGISIGSVLWLYDQPTAYYRRHLLLHEGTHAFMAKFLGGCGPGWFMEGTAELMATHRLDEQTGRLTLGIMPRDRTEVPMLGRIKLIHDARKAGRVLDLPTVMEIDNNKQLENEPYAWCWSAAEFLEKHPRYHAHFRRLQRLVLNPGFNELVRREFADDWGDVQAEWQSFVATLDHGYDFERMAIDFHRGRPLDGQPRRVTIAADRGWQPSGAWLEAGKSYHVAARGRYQIAAEQQEGLPWPCEPGGVSIEYHEGRPLGRLLGAIDGRAHGATLADPIDIGLGTTIKPVVSGTLYLRVNDSAGRLDDNRGTLTVRIAEATDATSGNH